MKRRTAFAGIGLLLAINVAMAELVAANSQPFSFPAQAGAHGLMQKSTKNYFTCQNLPSKIGVMQIAWSLPSNLQAKEGSIRIYSLLGQQVQSFPVKKLVGSINWNVSKMMVPNGVYLVRLAYGSYVSNLQMVYCN
jgi:hypothetical protein